jgi:hypothetical protein
MKARTRIARILLGLIAFSTVLVAGFSIALPAITRWGATDEEVAMTLPGDKLLAKPLVDWTTATTINAPPERVWPWIAQIGDTRGGFYSYTFIENQIGSLMGSGDYHVVYHNADRIVPEWQNPQPGEQMIQGVLKVAEAKPNEYLLADSVTPDSMGWTWVWSLQPVNGGAQTRLISRSRVQPPPGPENPIMFFVFNVGGFVMMNNMMQGIQQRAEGVGEPPYIETIEIALWFAAFIAGMVAAVAFVAKKEWKRSLVVAVASVIVLLVLTIVQPVIWIRIVLDVALWFGVVWSLRTAYPSEWLAKMELKLNKA